MCVLNKIICFANLDTSSPECIMIIIINPVYTLSLCVCVGGGGPRWTGPYCSVCR